MSKTYEEELYSFFTNPVNFDTMVKVAAHLDDISKTIIKDFWNDLKTQLEEKAKEKGAVWKVGYSGKFEDRWTKLWIYHRDWLDGNRPIVAVAYEALNYGERPFVGVFVDLENGKYKPDAIRTSIRGIRKLKELEHDDDLWWAKWEFLPFEFTSRQQLAEILPGKRQTVVEKVAELGLDILSSIEKQVPKILVESRKSKAGK